jgi:hypothetical protein
VAWPGVPPWAPGEGLAADGVGFGVAEGDGEAACDGGVERGGDLVELPFQESATELPAGTFWESTPALAYVQVPEVPFDHQSPQYASAGGVLTQDSWSADGALFTRHTNPCSRCTRVRLKPDSPNTVEAYLPLPPASHSCCTPPPSSWKSTTTVTPDAVAQEAADAGEAATAVLPAATRTIAARRRRSRSIIGGRRRRRRSG